MREALGRYLRGRTVDGGGGPGRAREAIAICGALFRLSGGAIPAQGTPVISGQPGDPGYDVAG